MVMGKNASNTTMNTSFFLNRLWYCLMRLSRLYGHLMNRQKIDQGLKPLAAWTAPLRG